MTSTADTGGKDWAEMQVFFLMPARGGGAGGGGGGAGGGGGGGARVPVTAVR